MNKGNLNIWTKLDTYLMEFWRFEVLFFEKTIFDLTYQDEKMQKRLKFPKTKFSNLIRQLLKRIFSLYFYSEIQKKNKLKKIT